MRPPAFLPLLGLLCALSAPAGAAGAPTVPSLPPQTAPISAPTTSTPVTAVPAQPLPWIRIDAPLGASYLSVPASCRVRACALVVVSHPRAQSAERLRDSVPVNVLLAALHEANFAVLLGGDAGPVSWGSPAAMQEVAAAHASATNLFAWNGRTYALGLSMGGLLALRSTLPGSPYPVEGAALIDAWVNLSAAWHSAPARQGEIDAAYALAGLPPGPEADPLAALALAHAAGTATPLPLFLVYSPDDQTVPMHTNGQALAQMSRAPAPTEITVLTGPHLGGNRFTPALARRLAAFFAGLEAAHP